MSTQQVIIEHVIIPFAIGIIQKIVTEENVKHCADKLFDFIEELVVDTDTSFDDKAFLPLVRHMRKSLDI